MIQNYSTSQKRGNMTNSQEKRQLMETNPVMTPMWEFVAIIIILKYKGKYDIVNENTRNTSREENPK